MNPKEAVIEQARKVRLAYTGTNIDKEHFYKKVTAEVYILNQKLDVLDESEDLDNTIPEN